MGIEEKDDMFEKGSKFRFAEVHHNGKDGEVYSGTTLEVAFQLKRIADYLAEITNIMIDKRQEELEK